MNSSIYSTASDVYAFGIVAWELLTESIAFEDKTGFDLIDIVVGKKMSLSVEHLHIDQSIKAMVSACMSFEFEARPSADSICKVLCSASKKNPINVW